MRIGFLSLVGVSAIAFLLSMPTTGGSWSEWRFHTLYRFMGGNDGVLANAPVIGDAHGTLYGTTGNGGGCSIDPAVGCGTVYEIEPPSAAGGRWKESILYRFTGGADGGNPNGALVADANGALYGVTADGGASNVGTIFKLAPTAGGAYVESVLYSFTGGHDGAGPNGALLLDAAGNLYGETNSVAGAGRGTVFELAGASPPPPGMRSLRMQTAMRTLQTLYAFTGTNGDGSGPHGGLVSVGGALYGTTFLGGVAPHGGRGTVFKLSPPGNGGTAWTETVIYSFKTRVDGYLPQGPLLPGSDGALFGTTSEGGAFCEMPRIGGSGCGTVFELRPPARGGESWTKQTLYSFGAPASPAFVNGGLLMDGRRRLYGTTTSGGANGYGAAFRITPPNTGYAYSETTLADFTKTDPAPQASLYRHGSSLYGTTAGPGTPSDFGLGTIFAIDFR